MRFFVVYIFWTRRQVEFFRLNLKNYVPCTGTGNCCSGAGRTAGTGGSLNWEPGVADLDAIWDCAGGGEMLNLNPRYVGGRMQPYRTGLNRWYDYRRKPCQSPR